MTVRLGDCVDEASEDGGQESPEVGEDLADVVTAAAEHSEEGAAEGALEGAACKAAIGLHVADLGLDGAAAPEQSRQPRRQAAARTADEHPGVLHPWPR